MTAPALVTTPPPAEVVAQMSAIEGVRIEPTMLGIQEGPDRHLGPEGAGAVLILQATFVDHDRAAEFWRTAAGLMERLADTPGFIRRFTFRDGPHFTLLALWRRLEDAHAFFRSGEHQAAMRELFRNRWQYSHFAGLWQMAVPRERVIFCQKCDGVTPARQRECTGCGTTLLDPFRSTDRAGR